MRGALTLVEVLVVCAIFALLAALALGSVQRVRAAAARVSCQNNLRNIGLATQSYCDAQRAFPPSIRRSPDPHPYASWLTRILPHIEQTSVWQEMDADYARQREFSRPGRHRGESRAIPTYLCPSEPMRVSLVAPEGVTVAFTHYLGVAGLSSIRKEGCLFFDSHVRPAEVTDGLSSTLLVGERPPSPDLRFGWWYAGVGEAFDGSADMSLGVREYVTTFRAPTCRGRDAGFRAGSRAEMCDTFHFWSNHPGGANFALADGSVRFVRYESASVLEALSTRAGGEAAALLD